MTIRLRFGKCEVCGQTPRQLIDIESGQRLCRECLKELKGELSDEAPQADDDSDTPTAKPEEN